MRSTGTGASTMGSVAGSGAATPRGHSAGEPPSTAATSADANNLELRFVPNDPGTYTSELLMLSPLDVRL